MLQKICSQHRKNGSFELRTKKNELENEIEFNEIVKFLNAQKAVMDYAGLN